MSVPSTTWRMLSQRSAGEKLPTGLDAAWNAAAGFVAGMIPRRSIFTRRANAVMTLERHFADMSDARLRERADRLREVFRRCRETPEQLARAFALLREVAFRKLGERPYPVQVIGAIAIEAGCIAEMATGEGKTLTATMPAAIAGWRGRGCHVVTTNEYLARRDAEWMRPIYAFCGLSAAHIEQEMAPPLRREAYNADITYCTNKDVAADFLRDRLAIGRSGRLADVLLRNITEGGWDGQRVVQRGLHCAIIDEADSVLIDEAVTPLIISGDAPNPQQVQAFERAASLAGQLEPHRDYRVDQRFREVDLTGPGRRRLAELAKPLGGVWVGDRRREELVLQALTARELYLPDKQYVIDEGKIVIVDEFTGRLMPDREWRDGLHQAVMAKESVEIQPPKDTHARVSFQRFFRLYGKLSGMTGTAAEAGREFWQIYRLPVVVVPTHRPCIREYPPDRVFATEQAKWAAVVERARDAHRTGQPVLIGTRSVRASELLGRLLSAEGLDHQILNAVRHAEEAQIVAEAGQAGRITVATNMAGRGTNIKLGRGVAELGGLFVIATERHEAGRIDRQLFGRSARQGAPGVAQAFVSLDDELIRRYAPRLAGGLARRYGRDGEEIVSRWARLPFRVAQKRAERMALRQRKGVLQTDDWLGEHLGFAGCEK